MFEALRKRVYIYITGIVFVFVVFVIRLIFLQLVEGSLYSQRSKANMENYIPIAAPRGEIYDRNFQLNSESKVLSSNRLSFNIVVRPSMFKSRKLLRETLLRLCDLLVLDYEKVAHDIVKNGKTQKTIIKEDVDFKTIVQIASYQHLYPNIEWEDVNLRVYNEAEIFSHVIGYIGSIQGNELKGLRRKAV
jgi:penicillin-binding protein 2